MPWGKNMTQWRRDIGFRFERNEQDVGNNLAQLNASVQLLSRQVAALPVPIVQSQNNTNWGINGVAGFSTKASVQIVVPAGKTNVQIQVTAGVAMLDTTSGGLAVGSARIVINNISSPVFQASKDAAASAVNNIITPSFGISFNGLTPGGTITVNLDCQATNPSAYPTSSTNYASLTVLAIFTP